MPGTRAGPSAQYTVRRCADVACLSHGLIFKRRGIVDVEHSLAGTRSRKDRAMQGVACPGRGEEAGDPTVVRRVRLHRPAQQASPDLVDVFIVVRFRLSAADLHVASPAPSLFDTKAKQFLEFVCSPPAPITLRVGNVVQAGIDLDLVIRLQPPVNQLRPRYPLE